MKKKWLRSTLSLLLTGSMILSMAPTVKAEGTSAAKGTTYYVDSVGGSDSNSGTSESQAFKTLDKVNDLNLEPGDQVLLKAGSKFEDQALHFTKDDSGSKENPVIISTYGTGERPQIRTNGHGQWELNYGKHLDNTNHKWHGTVSSCILIEDTEYIEISGLELTNDRASATDTEKDKAYNDAYAMDRTGVAGVAQDNGTVDHIVLDDLYIHDVTGNVYNKHMTNGGIYFIVEQPANETATGISRFNDVQIRNCYLDTVNRWGIAVGYTYQWDKFQNAYLTDEVMSTYGSSNVVIENNYLNNVGGDAITTMYLDRPLVQYNVSEGAAAQINTTDYAQQQPILDATTGNDTGKKQGVGAGRVAAGIWPWKCKNAIFQYNECFNTMNASCGNGDGQPWDADYGDGTNYQYNYSHGNTASTIMFCGPQSVNNTFRYNISQKEDMGPLDPAGNTGNTQIYNNTFYIKEGINSIWSSMHSNDGPATIENNIFYFEGDTPADLTGNRQQEQWYPTSQVTYDNNLYYNVSTYPNDANAVKVEAGTDVLVNPGSGPVAAAQDKAARFDENGIADETVFGGYKLAADSPAINAGKLIVDKNGYAIERDFFGNKVTGIPDIGAHESGSVALKLISSEYAVNEEAKTITFDVNDKVSVDTFLTNIVVEDGVEVTATRGSATLTGGVHLKAGDKITVAYGDQAIEFTVAVEDLGNGSAVSMVPREELIATAGSAETAQEDNKAANAIDGNISTIWHTAWGGATPENRYITLEVTGSYEIEGYVYTPRVGNSSGAVNGVITKYQISVSNDNSTWTEVASGTWASDSSVKTVMFDEPVQAKYVKLLAVESVNDFASAAEVGLIGNYTGDTVTPQAPVLSAEEVTQTSVVLKWTKSADTDVVEYQLKQNGEVIATFDASADSYTVMDLTKATEYKFTLVAVDENNNVSEESVVTVTTKDEHKHSFGEWVVVKQPTEEETGLAERVCACGEKETKVLAKLDPKPVEKPIASEEQKQEAKDYLEDCKGYYTKDSFESEEAWVAYQEAVAALEEILAKDNLTEEELQEAINAVDSAVPGEVTDPEAPEAPGTETPDTDDKDDSVQTGDSASIMIWVMAFAMAAVVVVMRKRTNR